MGPHIELRTSIEPLLKRVSKLTSTVVKKGAKYKGPDANGYPMYAFEDIPNKFVMKQVFFHGGKVLGYVRSPLFERKMGLRKFIPKGVALELNKEQIKLLDEIEWEAK